MKHSSCRRVFVVVYSLVSVAIGEVRRVPSSFLAAPVGDPATAALRVHADGAGSEQEKQPGAGLSMQVSETELQNLTSKLSEKCGEQFKAMMQGTGSQLHTFGDPNHHGALAKADREACENLNGSMCPMVAQVALKKAMPQGRTSATSTTVEGNGCLPSKCISDGDLGHLAKFFRLKAKDALPGNGVQIQLRVDCTTSGGSTVNIGDVSE
eukprot:TRINITY_DN66048_c0_g1_i1.p1 TRINITY_DN66048_c0_g1~~TRINITY_DN66048_c0_g1_i1.p1  ORF type:complete len:210 (+),score=47.85 TRINITY_DN66048_c0_g1_i1:81-710(+)